MHRIEDFYLILNLQKRHTHTSLRLKRADLIPRWGKGLLPDPQNQQMLTSLRPKPAVNRELALWVPAGGPLVYPEAHQRPQRLGYLHEYTG